MTTIGFYGDSFCAGREPESWCVLLAGKLNAKIVNWGQQGRSIWSTFMAFNRRIKNKNVPDYNIFCWTEPYRLYSPDLILSANTQPLDGVDPNVYKALDDYWKYLHNYDKDEMSYEYALRYYDQNVLSKIEKQIVQMWSFRPFETAGKNAGIELTSGKFIDESMFEFSKSDEVRDGWGTGTINHMTIEQNKTWAEKVYKVINA